MEIWEDEDAGTGALVAICVYVQERTIVCDANEKNATTSRNATKDKRLQQLENPLGTS